jgi:hypothetical protein
LPHPVDATHLLLVETGAKVPDWLDLSQTGRLDQGAVESQLDFVERSSRWLVTHPTVNTVVVALSTDSDANLEARVQILGAKLVVTLVDRPKARLLLSAPPNTSERMRHRLLGLTAALAQHEDGQRACVVGAHFSASPPSSGRLPVSRP